MVKHRSGTRWSDNREVGSRCVRSAPCTRRRGAQVSWFSLKTKVDGFFRFSLKTGGYGSCGLASKPLARVSRFRHQKRQLWFGDLAHKITTTVSWFGPQNQMGYALSVAPQNRREDEDSTRHASRTSDLLHVEASRARVSQSSLKTGGGTAWMVHMASSQRSRGDEVEHRRVDAMRHIRLFYSNFIVFIVLGYKGSLVIRFPINRTPRDWWRGKHSVIPLPPPSHSCFLRGVDVLHGVREEKRESE
jgi:hypothetical protein